MAREVELKSVVDDLARCRAAVEAAGGRLVFEGRLEDRRYDGADRRFATTDLVLRLRVYRTAQDVRAVLDWKGPTQLEDGYKVREEISTGVGDPEIMHRILVEMGYVVTREIDRTIAQYELDQATVRFESYPRMDDLVEVEGDPEHIERAIAVLGLPREGFTTDRLAAFGERFLHRTGELPATSFRELRGDLPWRGEDG